MYTPLQKFLTCAHVVEEFDEDDLRIFVNPRTDEQPLRKSYKNTTLQAGIPQRIVMNADAISEGPEYNEDLGNASGCSKCCRP